MDQMLSFYDAMEDSALEKNAVVEVSREKSQLDLELEAHLTRLNIKNPPQADKLDDEAHQELNQYLLNQKDEVSMVHNYYSNNEQLPENQAYPELLVAPRYLPEERKEEE